MDQRRMATLAVMQTVDLLERMALDLAQVFNSMTPGELMVALGQMDDAACELCELLDVAINGEDGGYERA